jgi:hypothetical protein
MKTRVVILFFLCAGVAFAQTATPMPLVDADPVQCFKDGAMLQAGFEVFGFMVRLLRTLKAGANVDIGG